MSVNLDVLLAGHAVVLADLDRRAAAADEREAKARRVIDDCVGERREIEEARRALMRVEQLYRERFVPIEDADSTMVPVPAASWEKSSPIPLAGVSRPRARIGAQRYRMFVYLRDHEDQWSSQMEIASTTGLDQARVRKQMRVDVADGYVAEQNDLFQLTRKGAGLLLRFQIYRRDRGQPLPPLEGAISDDDNDDNESSLENFTTETQEAAA